jgi:hypothetical protein
MCVCACVSVVFLCASAVCLCVSIMWVYGYVFLCECSVYASVCGVVFVRAFVRKCKCVSVHENVLA